MITIIPLICFFFVIRNHWQIFWCIIERLTHPATKCRRDVVVTFFCTSQRRHKYVSNKTLNDVSMERRQIVSVIRFHSALLERRDDVLRECNNDVPSVCLHDVSNKSQMKYPTTSQWYIMKASL